jgi:hypothetical protein
VIARGSSRRLATAIPPGLQGGSALNAGEESQRGLRERLADATVNDIAGPLRSISPEAYFDDQRGASVTEPLPLARTLGRCEGKQLPNNLDLRLRRDPKRADLCRDRQVSSLLEQPPKLRLWSEAHGPICLGRRGSLGGDAGCAMVWMALFRSGPATPALTRAEIKGGFCGDLRQAGGLRSFKHRLQASRRRSSGRTS